MREPKILNNIFRNSLGYVVAVGAVALATWLKLLAQPNIIPTDVPILYLVAIVPIAIFFGLGPSLLVCVLSFLAYDYYFIPPIHQITYSADAGPILAIFLIVGVLFSYLTSNLRRQNQVANKEIVARKQTEAELIKYRDHLEELVQQRTFELEKTNSELKTEIIEHKKDEEALRQSEERWATTLSSIGDGVIATDMLGRVTFMNTVAQDLTGWKTGEANQKPIAEVFNIVNETTRQKAENPVDKVLQLGIICSLANHTILIQKDGAEISIDDSGAPIKDAQDLTTGVVLVFRDITERRKAELLLRQVEERNRLLADILDHASQPFGIGLPDGSLGIVNKAFCDLTGYTAEELKTMDWAKVLTPPEYVAMEAEKLNELVTNGQPVRYQKEYIRKDKSRVPIELLVHLMRNAEGQAEYYYSFLTDISERKRAEEEKQTTLNRFYTILSKMPLGILLVTREGQTEFANQTFCDTFHLSQSPEEVKNLAAIEVIKRIQHVYANPEQAVARIAEIVNRGEPVKDEEVPLQDGRVVLRDFIPIWLGENRYGRLWVHRDITERKKAEDALKASEEKYRNLFANMVEEVHFWKIEYDDLGRIKTWRLVDANPPALKTWGIGTIEDIKGKTTDEIFGPGSTEHYMPVVQKIVAEGFPYSYEDFFPQLRKFFQFTSVPLRGYFITTGTDITKIKDTEESLRTYAASLEASNKELESFSYSVSHDLRAPLRSITGFSAVLLEDYANKLDKEGKEYLHKIQNSGEKMGQLMDDLLKLARVTRVEMNCEDVNLTDLTEKVIEELATSSPKHRVSVNIDPNLKAYADNNLLRQVMENLLSNAWKYSGKTVKPKIEIGTIMHEGKQAFFVRDNGVGFDMAYADKLFQPFQRLHTGTDFAGTGIGLSIVQRIIQRHGGQVWAEGKVGEGATFYFTLN